MSRAVAGHAASIGVAGSLSFVFAGALNGAFGWRATFVASGFAALIGWLIVLIWAPPRERAPAHDGGALFDFRPVLRNRSAMAYALAYCAHTWEMNALRGWVVAFLAYVIVATGDGGTWVGPTVVATVMGFIGTWTSVVGNELSIRLGRQRLVRLAMLSCAVMAAGIGFLGSRSYPLAAALVLAYGVLIWLDSSSLTAGAAGSADPSRRGATLALHSMAGYAGGFVGPIIIGWILDRSGGMSPVAWGLAFLHIAVIGLLGRFAFVALAPCDLVGDRSAR
jgi:predicted MFS family arabinose efflux permease